MWNGQTVTVAYLADFGITKQSSVALTSGVSLVDTCASGTPIFMAPVCCAKNTGVGIAAFPICLNLSNVLT